MIKIGLTGRSGAGKSEVCKILKGKGYFVIDADKVSRDVVEKGEPALCEIVSFFGKEVLHADGNLNRGALGDIVFNNSGKLEKLNSIIFPHITRAINELINQSNPKMVIFDAPTLIESGMHLICDYIFVVSADDNSCIERLMNRDNISFDQANARLSKQLTMDEFKKYANFIIKNDGRRDDMLTQVEDMISIFGLYIEGKMVK